MISLVEEFNAKAAALGIPYAAQMDITYRCNERCVHCYLDHDDHGEMSFEEIRRVLGEMVEAGVFQLTISGGEPLLRDDFFPIVRHARDLGFNVKLKTNAILIKEAEAAALRELYLDSIQISIYSHRAEVHDAVTKVRGSLSRSLAAARFLASRGLKVTFATVLMRQNITDYSGVQALANDIGAGFMLDPTITPHLSEGSDLLALRITQAELRRVQRDASLVDNPAEFCAPPKPASDDDLDSLPCSAGHSSCYVSPYGDVFPCVQFPLPCGNIRRQSFTDIWRNSAQLEEVRTIRVRDLPVCSSCANVSSCSRCPGLAYMEGNMRGPSTADCEKSFVRTGIPSANMLRRQ